MVSLAFICLLYILVRLQEVSMRWRARDGRINSASEAHLSSAQLLFRFLDPSRTRNRKLAQLREASRLKDAV